MEHMVPHQWYMHRCAALLPRLPSGMQATVLGSGCGRESGNTDITLSSHRVSLPYSQHSPMSPAQGTGWELDWQVTRRHKGHFGSASRDRAGVGECSFSWDTFDHRCFVGGKTSCSLAAQCHHPDLCWGRQSPVVPPQHEVSAWL